MKKTGNTIRKIAAVSILPFIILISCTREPSAVIYLNKDAGRTEDLAAHEIRKYVYQRTGLLLGIREWESPDGLKGDAILVGQPSSVMMKETGYSFPELASESFILKTLAGSGGRMLLVSGGSETGTLYAAYHLAETMGIGFYLDGDIIPDRKIDFVFPDLDVKKAPLFSRRGIQPFHDFPEGPDWWNREDYMAVLAQLPKLKMNFIGFHTYPEGSVGPEPLTWIGLAEDINPDGTVKNAYHARHFTTLNGTWGYLPEKTSDYSFGAGQLFDRDDFGAEYMRNRSPWPKPGDETALFNDMGDLLSDVFSFAEDLGIRTCLGTEVPLILPDEFIASLKQKGLDPESGEVRQRIYEGIFTRIKRTHPLDFYWFWTPENWTWSGNSKKDIDNTVRDFNAAIKALDVVKPGFSLATCGWVLGPASDRAMFDNYLPKSIAFSCINRNLGWEPVDSAFVKIDSREKWAIPWMEDDPGLTIPQFWAGRMRRDAADACAYGCNGFFGIHWRTRELGMNVSALAKAAWDQPWNPQQGKIISPEEVQNYLSVMEGPERKIRDIETTDFYNEWCKIQFGDEVAEQAAVIFSSLDGVTEKTVGLQSGLSRLPRPADWINGPGGIALKTYSWDSIRTAFNFVDDFEKLRPEVKGNGNLERFDYWIYQFRYLKAFEKLACSMHDFNVELKEIEGGSNGDRTKAASEKLVPIVELEAEELEEIHKNLLSSVTTWGGIGNITNWQQHNIEGQILPQIRKVNKLTGDSSWCEKLFPGNLPDVSRIIVPSPQTVIRASRDYTVKVICLNLKPVNAVIRWRPLGVRVYREVDLTQESGTYWVAIIPSSEITGDFEYHIRVDSGDGKEFVYPASSPGIDQAVVVFRN